MAGRVSISSYADNKAIKITVDVGDLVQRMNELPDAIRNLMIRTVFKQALQPWVVAAKARAPVRTGALSKNIKIRAGKSSRTKVSRLVTSSDKGEYLNSGTTYYGWFVEKGFKHHLSHKDVPGKFFLAEAFNENAGRTIEYIETALGQLLDDYFKG